MSNESFDVVVVGAGTAAMAAALACDENGAERILLLEKAPPDEFGGNLRFSSHSGFRWVQSGPDEIQEFVGRSGDAPNAPSDILPYTEADFHEHLTRASDGQMDAELQDILVSESNSAMHWLLDLGLSWELDLKMQIDGKYYFEPGYSIDPEGGGPGQLERMREMVGQRGIELRYNTPVTALHADSHRVEGVQVGGPDDNYPITAPIVILCSGGFQANPAMRAQYLEPNSDNLKIRGSRHNTGEVLKMALDIGAARAGDWTGSHSSVVNAGAPDWGLLGNIHSRYSYPYGISVNALGDRFVDEGKNLRMLTYASMGRSTLAQPGGTAWQIFDQKVLNYRNSSLLRPGYHRDLDQFSALTIGDLAKKIGVDADRLEQTVAEFNEAISDEAVFDPTILDGRTTYRVLPPKTNWANAIDEPPFMAFPVTAGITFTFGGLKVDGSSQVLNTDNEPIRGLYASGDIVGMFHKGYVGGSGNTRNMVFSRRAGRHATA
jgi:tricarballylate dehydrogenase